MGLSARLFGVNGWSILVPQALMGVATVGLVPATVRRVAGHGARLLAGSVTALTPVVVLMFRFSSPNASRGMLLVGAAFAMTRGAGHGVDPGGGSSSRAWTASASSPRCCRPVPAVRSDDAAPASRSAPGRGPSPGRGVRPVGGRRRAGARIESALRRWFAEQQRAGPLVLGYNGLGRLSGNETGSVVGAGEQGHAGQWGSTGVLRVINTEFGGQVPALIPAVLVLSACLLWERRRRPRTDALRAHVLFAAPLLVDAGRVL